MGTNAIVGLVGGEWITGRKASTYTRQIFWVSGVSWGDGDQVVKTFNRTTDRSKAIRLRTKSAIKLAVYLKACRLKPVVTQ